jgi:hypothetical protein
MNLKDELEELILIKNDSLYESKLSQIQKILKRINKNRIIFNDNYDSVALGLLDDCINSNDKCDIYQELCDVVGDKKCIITIPKTNLITQVDNETKYYKKMSDELLRNKRISFLLLNSKTFVSFNNINFKINDNEIILLKSLLIGYYKQKMILSSNNKYLKNITYDDLQYSEDKTTTFNISSCITTIPQQIQSLLWANYFIPGTNEFLYNINDIYCTYQPLIDLYKNKYNSILTIEKIKEDLYYEYKKYIKEYIENERNLPTDSESIYTKITHISETEGNKSLIQKIKQLTLDFDTLFFLNNYKLTTFDMWLLFTKYKIPNIILSNKPILETLYSRSYFKTYGNIGDKYSFIIIQGNSPIYRLLTHDKTSNDSNNNDNKQYNYYFEPEYILSKTLTQERKQKLSNVILNNNGIQEFLNEYNTNLKVRNTKQKILVIK